MRGAGEMLEPSPELSLLAIGVTAALALVLGCRGGHLGEKPQIAGLCRGRCVGALSNLDDADDNLVNHDRRERQEKATAVGQLVRTRDERAGRNQRGLGTSGDMLQQGSMSLLCRRFFARQ